jgi:hypothetical protein
MCFAIYAIYTYTSDAHNKRVSALKDLKSTYTYYDNNRRLKGITGLTWLKKDANNLPKMCPAGYEKVVLYSWPGSKEGYLNTVDLKYYAGKSTDYVQEPPHTPVTTDFWKGGAFCVKRVEMEDLKFRLGKGLACTKTNSMIGCTTCQCYENIDWAKTGDTTSTADK